jgi:hypothetical protein
MAYTSSALAPREMAFSKTAEAASIDKPFFVVRVLFGRLIAAMMVARTRQAEREIARYLSGTGGKFTDEAEREIERRFLSNQSHW